MIDEEELEVEEELDINEDIDNEEVEETPEVKQSKVINKNKFLNRLAENIRNNCRNVLPLGNTKIVQINRDFCRDLSLIFTETIVEMLLENRSVYFDQFGVFRITKQKDRMISTPFIKNGEPTLIPSFNLIRFKPSPNLKKRIRGEAIGRVKKKYMHQIERDENGNEVYVVMKKDKDQEEKPDDFIESEVWEDAD